jgi:hypothetical protein
LDALKSRIIEDSLHEDCNVANVFDRITGNVCGSYYKILGLNKRYPIDHLSLNSVWLLRRSLFLNSSFEFDFAVKLLDTAFECLSNDVCKLGYDAKLDYLANQMREKRLQHVKMVVHSMYSLSAVSLRAANFVAANIVNSMKYLYEISSKASITVDLIDIFPRTLFSPVPQIPQKSY